MTPEQLDAHLRRFNQIFAKEFSYAADPDYGSLEIIRGGKVLTTWCYADDPSDGFAEYKESAFQGYLLCAENMQEIIESAHMAGQAEAGIDPSFSNAKAYAMKPTNP